MGTNLTFLSNNKYPDNSKVKNMFNKFSKKKSNSKHNEIISSNNKSQKVIGIFTIQGVYLGIILIKKIN
jgi:hypothetical protein